MSIPKRFIIFSLGLLCMQSHADWPWEKKSPETAASNVQIKNGMTEKEVVAKLGEARALIENGSKKTLMYSGVLVEFQNNRVVNLPVDFSAKLKQEKEKQAKKDTFAAEKNNKGLIFFDGEWMTPFQKKKRQLFLAANRYKATKKPSKKNIDYVMKDKNGQAIDHSLYTQKGQVTVVDFYADWCEPCNVIAPHLDKLVKSHSGVVLVKVRIGTWESSLAKTYNVTSVPNIRVFDRDGIMVAAPSSDLKKIEKSIKRAKKM